MDIKPKELLKVTECIELLANLDEKTLTIMMNTSPKEYARLLIAMGALIDKAAGNLNKLFEVVTALELADEYDRETYEIVHVKHEYGTDLRIINKATKEAQGVEIKTSVVKKGKDTSYQANWLFTLSASLVKKYRAKSNDKNLALLIGSVYEKQENGVTCFVARYGTERINHYKVDGAFIALYCAKKLVEGNDATINFGAKRCKKCAEYHRIQHMMYWAEKLRKRIERSGKPFEYRLDYFTDNEWPDILKAIPTQTGCNK